MKRQRKSMTRKQKIALYLLPLPLMAVLVYLFLGCPPLTAEMAMRRAEKAALIGPSTIIGAEDINVFGYDKVLVGESEYGYTLYGYDSETPEIFYLVYREKAGSLTLTAVTENNPMNNNHAEAVPIFLFSEYPAAVRAELDLVGTAHYNGEDHAYEYYLSAQRGENGYFRFDLPYNPGQFTYDEDGVMSTNWDYDNPAVSENELIHYISQTLGGGHDALDEPITVTVRLYDKTDQLILEKALEVYSYDHY